jgi:hypothetical protein
VGVPTAKLPIEEENPPSNSWQFYADKAVHFSTSGVGDIIPIRELTKLAISASHLEGSEEVAAELNYCLHFCQTSICKTTTHSALAAIPPNIGLLRAAVSMVLDIHGGWGVWSQAIVEEDISYERNQATGLFEAHTKLKPVIHLFISLRTRADIYYAFFEAHRICFLSPRA